MTPAPIAVTSYLIDNEVGMREGRAVGEQRGAVLEGEYVSCSTTMSHRTSHA